MNPVYNIRCNQYASISLTAYEGYLKQRSFFDSYKSNNVDVLRSPQEYLHLCKSISTMDDFAVSAIVFQALAIEAYVNLAGAYVLGESEFYSTHERKSTVDKLKILANKLNGKFSDALLNKVKTLFYKRNCLVHQKPKKFIINVQTYNYLNPAKNFEDIEAFFQEQTIAYENIDEEINTYFELQEELRSMRACKLELVEEIKNNISINLVVL